MGFEGEWSRWQVVFVKMEKGAGKRRVLSSWKRQRTKRPVNKGERTETHRDPGSSCRGRFTRKREP